MPSGTIDLQELTRRLATRTDFAVSCKSCNRKKGNLTGREFVRVPTETRLMKFDEIDELTNRRRLRSRERKRLQREEKRRRLEQRRELRERKSRVRQGRDRIRSEPFPRPAPRMSDDVSIPMDVHGAALERYRQRYAKLPQALRCRAAEGQGGSSPFAPRERECAGTQRSLGERLKLGGVTLHDPSGSDSRSQRSSA